MILGKLVLTNFSAYGDTQTIDLAPASTERPIVLIGGLNGAGKTSLLEAVRIALFGKRAALVSEAGSSYSGLLRDFIHDTEKIYASVELEFHTYALGERDTYRLQRQWAVSDNGKLDENLRAWKNGIEDGSLADAWDDFIDSLLPVSISHLFFFDGEKVAEMANENGARILLRTGVQSLLGIDLLARLQDDLGDLIGRKSKLKNGNGLGERLSVLDADIAELARQQKEWADKVIKFESELTDKNLELSEIEIRFKEEGAHLFLEKKRIEQDRDEARRHLIEVHEILIDVASGVLPLALVPNLIKEIRNQDALEQSAQQASTVLAVLEKRDKQVLNLVPETLPEIRHKVERFLSIDRSKRAQSAETEVFLNLSAGGRRLLAELEMDLAEGLNQARTVLDQYTEAETNLEAIEKQLSMVPPRETVRAIIAERQRLMEAIQEIESTLASHRNRLTQCEQAISYRRLERERILRQLSSLQAENSIDERIIRYAQKSRERASIFAQKILLNSISQLESLILDSVQHLFHKQKYICGIKIDSKDFTLHLINNKNQLLPINRLSAGERQLVIIAILWGLGKASGRPLPLIIDTPLGRLDSTHRSNLLDFYFPCASHQTILLATDTEITKNDMENMKSFTGKYYRLEHDDSSQHTNIMPGYFWSIK